MNDRERYLAVMTCREADRYPFYEMGAWGQAKQRWLGEGLPEEDLKGNWFYGQPKFAGLDRRAFMPINLKPIPNFERTIEETDRYIVFVDQWGRTRRGLKEGSVSGTRLSMDTFLDHFVKTRDDFLEVKKRLDPAEPSRYPGNWEELKSQWAERDYPLYLLHNTGFSGLYWNLRNMMGTEHLSYAFYDQPDLVHEILDFMVELLVKVTGRALVEVDVDAFIFNEDFACKSGPLISPKTFDEFFAPRFRTIIDFLRSHGVKVIELDSDGNTEVLLSRLIDVGVNCHWPLEVASGMDPVKIKKEYGKDLALMGGIDKRELAKGRDAIEQELRRKIVPLLDEGGYAPSVDHTVPPEVSLEDFRYYLELRRRIAAGEWR